jgi:hypothetical protein
MINEGVPNPHQHNANDNSDRDHLANRQLTGYLVRRSSIAASTILFVDRARAAGALVVLTLAPTSALTTAPRRKNLPRGAFFFDGGYPLSPRCSWISALNALASAANSWHRADVLFISSKS